MAAGAADEGEARGVGVEQQHGGNEAVRHRHQREGGGQRADGGGMPARLAVGFPAVALVVVLVRKRE